MTTEATSAPQVALLAASLLTADGAVLLWELAQEIVVMEYFSELTLGLAWKTPIISSSAMMATQWLATAAHAHALSSPAGLVLMSTKAFCLKFLDTNQFALRFLHHHLLRLDSRFFSTTNS